MALMVEAQADSKRWEVGVVGAGPAGLLAAIRAAERGRRTVLLEKNGKPGVKILMSGGTRCNLTQNTDSRGIVAAFGRPGRFLHSALARLAPQDLITLVEAEGVATKIERTGKVFPQSNRAADVLRALLARLQRSGCTLLLNSPVCRVVRLGGRFDVHLPDRAIACERLIVTSGGQSYPGCGTTGDGYDWLAELGHTIIQPRPALVPLTSDEPWLRPLSGITVPDTAVRLIARAARAGSAISTEWLDSDVEVLESRRGSMLFTHFGLSGPVVLDASRAVSGYRETEQLAMVCDFLPQRNYEEVGEWLRDVPQSAGRRQLTSVLADVLPRRLAEAMLDTLNMPIDRTAAALSRTDRRRLTSSLKCWPIGITGTRGFAKAEVTAGGVALGEIDSRTMQSKHVPGLFVAGEILDLDGPIGGYNFQAAFSTGCLAGEYV